MEIPQYYLPDQDFSITDAFVIIAEKREWIIDRPSRTLPDLTGMVNNSPSAFGRAPGGYTPENPFKPFIIVSLRLLVFGSEDAYNNDKPYNHERTVKCVFPGLQWPSPTDLQNWLSTELTKPVPATTTAAETTQPAA